MADAQSTGPGAGKLVIRNIGLLLSGDLENPILDADTVIAIDGKITAIGKAKDLDSEKATTVIDAKGTTLAPGLIDSHVHPVFGDWTPRQSQLNWIDSFLHGGVTTMVSAGEVHLPGRPKDVVGRQGAGDHRAAFLRRLPARRGQGPCRRAGAREGHGGGGFQGAGRRGRDASWARSVSAASRRGEEAKRMVAWARKYGIQSTIHTGGPSIPGSGLIDKDVVLEADADVIGHINGGHTALPLDQIRCLCEQCKRAIEIVHNGNEKAALFALQRPASWASSTA